MRHALGIALALETLAIYDPIVLTLDVSFLKRDALSLKQLISSLAKRTSIGTINNIFFHDSSTPYFLIGRLALCQALMPPFKL